MLTACVPVDRSETQVVATKVDCYSGSLKIYSDYVIRPHLEDRGVRETRQLPRSLDVSIRTVASGSCVILRNDTKLVKLSDYE